MWYEVKALRGKHDVVSFRVEAADSAEAIKRAESQDCSVLSIRPKRTLPTMRSVHRSRFPLVLFSQELLSLLDAGLNLVDAIETLTEKEHHPDVRRTLEKIVFLLYEGKTLSAAMQESPAFFPPLYVATVRASEKTGGISEALGRYVAYQSQLDSVRKKIINASIYPALLIIVGSLVVLFLMAYVVPKFASVYEGANQELPWLSRLLLDWGSLLQAHGAIVLGATVALILGTAYGMTRATTRQSIVRSLWQFPAFAERMRIYQLARFYRSLGMLLQGGIPLVRAMEMVSKILLPILRDRLELALQAIREGQAVSGAMEMQGLTTPVALRMLRVGERAGNMGEMMERVAAFYDEDMARWVEWFTRLFEPILMALIGIVIGVIVVLMYLPIFELAGSLQ